MKRHAVQFERRDIIAQLAGVDEQIDRAGRVDQHEGLDDGVVGNLVAAPVEQPGDVVGLGLDQQIGARRA
ncbi:hypothetical protein D3C72_580010 [compost metagenome]